ncbi:MAG: hypothetical protein IIT53_05455 [Fibrobacter sp.]|nr:hypothetical protein [Fibrobacter sp.]
MKRFSFALILALMVAACGDDDSGFSTRPSDDSSSSVCEDCDDASSSSVKSSSSGAKFSSSAKSSSSSAKSSSSSSAKSSSSSKEKSSSSVKGIPWKGPKEKYFNPDVNYGTVTDARDGKIYRTVQIGNQTWMAENLNFEYKVARGEGDTVSYGMCSTDNCEISGRYYTWAAAMDSAAVFSQNSAGCGFGHKCSRKNPVRGICPEGWHIPTGTEWETLYKEVGETAHALQAKGFEEWSRATDEFGFSALPVGLYYEGEILHIGNAYFWSTSEYDNTNAWDWYLGTNDGSLGHSFLNVKRDHFSVRCLKDESSVQQSSSSVASSSSTPEGYVDPSTVVTGTMTDERDGQTYKTVTIGTQTWMAENLNYESVDSYCYNDSAKYCAKYGRLYTWAAAMDSVGEWSTNGRGCGYYGDCSPTYPVRGVCPKGWHLLTKAELEMLLETVGGVQDKEKYWQWQGAGIKLKSTSGWNDDDGESGNGADSFGFSALPAGNGRNDGSFYDEGKKANFWSSTESTSSSAYGMYLNYYGDITKVDYGDKNNGFSVRCVKD